MKIPITYLFWLLLLSSATVLEAQTFRTEAQTAAVRTLRVSPEGRWDLPPIIRLNSNESIDIRFDLLGAAPEYYTYRVLHCDADWTPSSLTQPEYLEGLQNQRIEDYASSFNTTMDYVNYRLSVPNDRVRLKVSGNYVVEVRPEGDAAPILSACFSVVEPQAAIRMQVSPTTDRGVRTRYQALRIEVEWGADIRSPAQDLKVFALQNNRTDNRASLLRPLQVQYRQAVYDHSPALIFEAGNEYRSFEMTTTRYAGLHVASVEFFAPYYHTTLLPDAPRSRRSYLFGEDINGRMYVRNNEVEDPDIEADYQFVHFYLPCDKPFADKIYILSEAFNLLLDERSQMEYSAAEGGYVKSVLLKEGYYNYLYVNRHDDASPASAALVEGDYYQTENEYRVLVYARPAGARYDRLIGVETLQFK